MKIRQFPFILASILVAAHFLRSGSMLLVLFCVLFPLILLIKQRWVLIVAQIYAYFGAWLWAQTAIEIAQRRILMGEDWVRMAVILGTVAVFSIWAGLLLNSKKVKEHYL